MALVDKITDIADAIREISGSGALYSGTKITDGLTLEEMAETIRLLAVPSQDEELFLLPDERWVDYNYTDTTRIRYVSKNRSLWETLTRNPNGGAASLYADLRPSYLNLPQSDDTMKLILFAKNVGISNPEEQTIEIAFNRKNNAFNPAAGSTLTILLSDIVQAGNSGLSVQMKANFSGTPPRLLTVQIRDTGQDTSAGSFDLRMRTYGYSLR